MPEWDIPTDTPARIKDIEIIFGRIVYLVVAFAGLVFFVMLISAGIKFITAGGEAKQLESARKTLTLAVTGLVLIAVALLIMRFLERITGLDLTTFRIYIPN